MKKIIPLSLFLLLLPQLGFAQKNAEKCIDQFINLSIAATTRAVLKQTVSKMVQDEYKEGGTDGDEVKKNIEKMLDPKTCSKAHTDNQSGFYDDVRAKIRSKSALLAEFSRKKKVDSNHYWLFNTDNQKKEITEADICEDFQNAIATFHPCDARRFMMDDSSAPVSDNVTFEQSCKRLQAKIVASEKKEVDCQKQAEAKNEKERQPKAEISPDKPSKAPSPYTPSSSSSPFLREQNRQNPMRSKDQKPSAGGSGQ